MSKQRVAGEAFRCKSSFAIVVVFHCFFHYFVDSHLLFVIHYYIKLAAIEAQRPAICRFAFVIVFFHYCTLCDPQRRSTAVSSATLSRDQGGNSGPSSWYMPSRFCHSCFSFRYPVGTSKSVHACLLV